MLDFHFISGLPRSGSTLLASILRQNPAYTASIQTPIAAIIVALLPELSRTNESAIFFTDEQRLRILRGLFSAYYAENTVDVVFDNNRKWCAHIALLADLFPQSKVICCVRPASGIVDSIERLVRNNPTRISPIYGSQSNTTVYNRVQTYMAPDGVVGYSWNALRDAFYGEHKDRLVIVRYDDLARFPGKVIETVSKELGLAPFPYKFNAIEPIPGTDAFDAALDLPGLHDLKPEVKYEPRTTILPPDIFNSLPKPFWNVNRAATNPR
jgi:sulfotransferase